MLQRILGGATVLLGLTLIGAGVGSATLWLPDEQVVATLPGRSADEGATVPSMVVVEPGVLDLVDEDVTVRADVPDADPSHTVVIAVGRESDVLAWVGEDASVRVTGLQDWETLASRTETGSDADDDAGGDGANPETTETGGAASADPAGSDLWVQEVVEEGGASLAWQDRGGRVAVLIAAVGEPAVTPAVELTWVREVSAPWLLPGCVGGTLLLGAGVVLLLRDRRRRAGASQAEAPAEERDRAQGSPEPVAGGSASGAAIPDVTGGSATDTHASRSGAVDPSAAVVRPTTSATATGAVPSTAAASGSAGDGVETGGATPTAPLSRREIRERAQQAAEEAALAARSSRRAGRPRRSDGPGQSSALTPVVAPREEARPGAVWKPGSRPAGVAPEPEATQGDTPPQGWADAWRKAWGLADPEDSASAADQAAPRPGPRTGGAGQRPGGTDTSPRATGQRPGDTGRRPAGGGEETS